MPYRDLTLRPHLSTSWKQTLGNGRCWHFDAWLLYDEADSGAMYMVIQTRKGGRDVLTQHEYSVDWLANGEAALSYLPDRDRMARASFVTLQDRSMRELYGRLNRLHWNTIWPMTQRRPDEFTYSSIALHYVRAPSLEPILAGTVNYSRFAERTS